MTKSLIRLVLHRTYAASLCSPRSPCLGDLSFHGFACRIRSVRFLSKSRLRKSYYIESHIFMSWRITTRGVFIFLRSTFYLIRTYAASLCSPRSRRPLFSRQASVRRPASARSPCLGDLFHGFACRIRSVRFLSKSRLRKSY